MRLPSQSELNRLLSYDPDTGILTWRWQERKWFDSDRVWRIWNTKYAGKEAFTAIVTGYKCGRINKMSCLAHRVIWKLVYGTEPPFLDHQNGIRNDNKLINLREVTASENSQNMAIRFDNTSKVIGVSFVKRIGKWHAYLNYQQKRINIGHYLHKEDAIKARKQAELDYGFHPNHGRTINEAASLG